MYVSVENRKEVSSNESTDIVQIFCFWFDYHKKNNVAKITPY